MPFKGKKKKSQKPSYKEKMTAILATSAAICLLLMAGLALSGTAVAFAVIMPLFVICSPVLVPAGITVTLLAVGLMASGSSGATAVAILMWLYKKLTGKDLPIKKKPAAKPADKPAAKPDKKPEAKPDKKPAAKPEKKPAEKKPAAKPEKKPAAKPEKKPAAKPEKKPAAKPAAPSK